MANRHIIRKDTSILGGLIVNAEFETADVIFNKITSGEAYKYDALTDVHTFGSFPITPSGVPSYEFEFANKKYVDEHITASYWQRNDDIISTFNAYDNLQIDGNTTLNNPVYFGNNPIIGTFSAGKMYYDNVWKTLALELDPTSQVTLQIGQEELRYVFNNTGSVIPNGSAVVTTGVHTGSPSVATIALAKSDEYSTSWVLGLTTQEIASGHYGFVTVRGLVNDLNTDVVGWTVGDQLYLSNTVAGGLINTLPEDPALHVRVGRLIRKDAQYGAINVRLGMSQRLQDLSDTSNDSPVNGDIVVREGNTWVYKPMSSGSGSGSGVIVYLDNTATVDDYASILRSPVTSTPTVTASVTLSTNTVGFIRGFLYNQAQDRDVLNGGIWKFNTFAYISNTNGSGTASIIACAYHVVNYAGTVEISGSGTSRTATVSGYTGVPFVAGDANADITLSGYLQTAGGTFQITSFIYEDTVTIATPVGYTNEVGVAFTVHHYLFKAETSDIQQTGTPLLYTRETIQPSVSYNIADTTAFRYYGHNLYNQTKTISMTYNGIDVYSFVETPLPIRHNELAGLNLGNYKHLTATEYSDLVFVTGDQVIGGTKTFTSYPVSPSGYPSTDYQMANKKYVDDKVEAENIWDRSAGLITTHNLNDNLQIGGTTTLNNPLYFATNPTIGSFVEGKMYYDATFKTVSVDISNNMIMQIGQEEHMYVYNNSGDIITAGRSVYTTGVYHTGVTNVPTIALAKADNVLTAFSLGLTTTDIPNGSYGFVVVRGNIINIKTDYSGWNEGDVLWMSPTTAGELVNAVPNVPFLQVKVGNVIKLGATDGILNVRIGVNARVQDLADTTHTSPSSGDMMIREGNSWVYKPSAVISSSGTTVYLDSTPSIDDYLSITKTPVITTPTQTSSATASANSVVFIKGFSKAVAQNRTLLNGGIWRFNTFAYINSLSGTGTASIITGVYRVVGNGGTVAITGSGTSRTATITGSTGTPFVAGDANADQTIAGYLQTAGGTFQITGWTSATVATIATAEGYINEVGVSYTVHHYLFKAESSNIQQIGSPIMYSSNTIQGNFTYNIADYTAFRYYVKNNYDVSKTVSMTYNGETYYSYVDTPPKTMHNDLDGLNFGDYKHLTATEYSGLVFVTGDQVISGTKTFTSFPVTPSGVPSTDFQVANKRYVDDAVEAEKFWDKTGTTVYPHTPGDSVRGTVMKSNSFIRYDGTSTYGLDLTSEMNVIGLQNIVMKTAFDGTVQLQPKTNATRTADILTGQTYNGVANLFTFDNKGRLGIGTIPASQVHTFGTDNNDIDPDGWQANGFIVDGNADCDKNYDMWDNGVKKWEMQMYRNEGGEFWYLYNYEMGREPITVSEGGLIGINKQSNIMNYHSIYLNQDTGALNDMDVTGLYTQRIVRVYQIAIYSTGATDQFRWKSSLDKGVTWGSWSLPIDCDTVDIPIEYGTSVIFGNITGHNTNDVWQFTAFSQLPQGVVTINPRMFTEINNVPDYTVVTPTYFDYTANLNTSSVIYSVSILELGTKGVLYVGDTIKYHSLLISILTPATGCSLYCEYWNGSAWVRVDPAVNAFADGTNNLTKTGQISWDANSFADWAKTNPEYNLDEPSYNLYWLRFRSTTSISAMPVINSITPRGGTLFSVSAAYFDMNPMFEVNADGSIYLRDAYNKAGKITFASAGVGNGTMDLQTGGTNNVVLTVSDVTNVCFKVGDSGHTSLFRDNLFIGDIAGTASARLHIKGTTSDTTAYGIKLDNSSNVTVFSVRNDGTIMAGTWGGSNIPWNKVDKTGSSLADLATRNASDVTTSSSYRFVTDAQLTVINNTSNTNTGDETQSTIKTKLGVASSGVDGYLSGTDWTLFNGKQASGNYITALTSDVTASGPGSATATISNKAVTLAKMDDMATASFIGRNSVGTGVPQVLSVSTVRTMLSIDSVENTALSTWTGSTNITTVGTIGTGTWNATVIADGKIASALTGKTYNSLSLTAQTNGFTISGGTTSKTLTVALDANVAGTNTGDVTLVTNSGLSITNQVLNMGTPTTITSATTNSVTTSTHAHALTVTKSDVGLGNVENTALSTWAGSTNITTLGTIATGTVPWANVSKTGSSLANLATRSAGDLNSGNLAVARMPTGGNWALTTSLVINSGGADRDISWLKYSSGPGGAGNAYVYDAGLDTHTFNGAVTLVSDVTTAIPLTVKGAGSQSANLQNWTDSTNAVLASMSSAGVFTLGTGAGINLFDIDGTFVANSDSRVPTQKAVKTYVGSAISGAGYVPTSRTINGYDLSTNRTLVGSDIGITASGFASILSSADDTTQKAFATLDTHSHYPGMISKTLITDNGNGTINIASGTAYMYSGANWTGHLGKHTVPATTNMALTNNTVNYVYADYNSGSPIYAVTLNPYILDDSLKVILAGIFREGNVLHVFQSDFGLATATRLNERSLEEGRFVRTAGLVIYETPTRTINVSEGRIYCGCVAENLDAVISATDECSLYYHVAGEWNHSAITQYNNTQFDDGTGLQTVTAGNYVVNWIYRFVESNKHIAIVLGGGDYTITQARNSAVPTPPPILENNAILVGRMIVLKSASTAIQIDSAFVTNFGQSVAFDHNDLGGIQGGTTSQYYHLTSSEYTNLHDASNTSTGNFDVARMPLSGNWKLTGNLNFTDDETVANSILFIDEENKRIGVTQAVPANLLHIYGTSNTGGVNANIPNFLQLDSVADGDSGMTFAIDGVMCFDDYLYRNENGRFLRKWGQKLQQDVQIITETGRYGWLAPSNYPDYHTVYTTVSGGGSNDLIHGGIYNPLIPYNTWYQIQIDGTGTDTFKWRKSLDNGSTWTSWNTGNACSATETVLDSGLTVAFEGGDTGHTTSDAWTFTGFSAYPDATFGVWGTMFTEFNTTADYTQTTPVWDDLTSNAASTFSPNFIGLPIGIGASTKGCAMLGMQAQFSSAFVIISTASVNCSLVVEYWSSASGGSWKALSGADALKDGTLNLTQIGSIAWSLENMSDWVKTIPPGQGVDEGYNLYWIRLRSSTIMTTAPVCAGVLPHGDYRFAVHSGQLDPFPVFFVKGGGRTFIRVPDGRGTTFNIENENYVGNSMRFSVENAVPTQISMRYGGDDTSHETVYKVGGIDFNVTGTDAIITQKFNKAIKFYKNTTDLVLQLESDGTISTGITNYEALVTNDNDIPNKKYVDQATSGGLAYQTTWDANLNTPDITGATVAGYFWVVTTAGSTNLGGITSWAVGDWAVKTTSSWSKIPAKTVTWGTITGTLSNQTDLNSALGAKVDTTYLNNTWAGSANIATVGTITSGTWTGNRIGTLYLDTNVTAQGNTFNGTSQLVQTTGAGYLPALNGSLVTNIAWANVVKTVSSLADITTRSATDLTSGNLAIARMPSTGGNWVCNSQVYLQNSLRSTAYTMGTGPDMSLQPVVGGQSAIQVWWGLILKANQQSSVEATPTAIGAADRASVLIPCQKTGAIGLDVIRVASQTGDILRIDDENLTKLFSIGASGALSFATGASINLFDADGVMTANSDNRLPTQKAVVTYVGAFAGSTNITTVGTIGTGTWNATAIAWAKVNKTGSSLADLATRNASDISTSSSYRFVTDAQLTIIGNTSNTNTGDETQSTIKTKLGVASSGVDGYLSGTDWTLFNGKQASGNYITALTSDVTASGPGSATATISNSAVTLAKMADMATASFLGRNTAGTGAPEVLSVSTVRTMLSINNVENTALSTWVGSANITTLGTIGTGTWNATAIADGKIASALTGKTYNALSLTAQTNGFTISGGTTSKTLTVALDASVAGTNTGDVTLATNSGLALSNQVLNMGTPTTITSSTTNSVTTNTHAHALTVTKSDVGLSAVENTALSTWAGSSNITTVGTLTNLSVTNTISGSINGTAAKATNMLGGNSTTLLGSIGYQSNTDTTTLLSPNTTTTKQFLSQTGTGTNGAIPVWSTVSKSDVGLGSVENTALSTWVGSANITTLGTIGTGTWNATAIADGKIASALTGKTYNSLSLTAQTNGFTISGGTTSKTLTVALDANVAGTNTGDVTLATNSGLSITNQVLNMGTPTTITSSTTNSVTTNTHAHALTVTKTDVGLSAVENTALSTWVGTTNITTLGTIASGTWNATAITWAKVNKTGSSLADLGTRNASDITTDTTHQFVTSAQLTVIGNTSNTNSGDETQATIKTKLGVASSGVDGYLSGSDWTLFNGRQPAGNYITALTSDVTASGPGSATATIATNAVTYAKFQQIATASFVGRNTALTGNAETINMSTARTMLSINNVENTALSTWVGSANITTVGTIGTGTWNATAIADGKIASALTGKTYNALSLTAQTNGFTISGGTTSKTLTVALDASVSGTNTGDETQATIKTKLGVASAGVDGYLSGANWSTFNGKQDAGNYITALTSDVTASGPGSATATIASNVVTFAKMQQIATAQFLGRNTALTGNVESLGMSTARTMLSINNVENTALSTWVGSSNITTLGTIGTLKVGSAGASITLFSTDTTLAGNSDATIPTEKAIKAYVDGKSGSSFVGAVSTKTANYTLTGTDCAVNCDTTSSAFTITLPTAVGVSGKTYVIKRITAGTNRLTVATTSSQTIDGITTAIIDEQWASITVYSDGANWFIM